MILQPDSLKKSRIQIRQKRQALLLKKTHTKKEDKPNNKVGMNLSINLLVLGKNKKVKILYVTDLLRN